MLLNIIRYFRFKKIKTILNNGIIELSKLSIEESEKSLTERINTIVSGVLSRITLLDSLLAELLQESFTCDTATNFPSLSDNEEFYKESVKIWLFKIRDLITKHI